MRVAVASDTTSRYNYSSSGRIFNLLFSYSSKKNMEIYFKQYNFYPFLANLTFVVPLKTTEAFASASCAKLSFSKFCI